jgi:hypothetical protein
LAIFKFQYALSVLFVTQPISLKDRSIDRGKNALAFSKTTFEHALIFAAISVHHNSSSLNLVVYPITLELLAVFPPETSITFHFVTLKGTNICTSIWPFIVS